MASAGLQSEISVESSPTVMSKATSPATWSWIWFVVAMLIILGFHIRLFGRAVPPDARFP